MNLCVGVGSNIYIPGHEVQYEVILSLGMNGCQAAGAVDTVGVALGDVLIASDDLVTMIGHIRDLKPSILLTCNGLRQS